MGVTDFQEDVEEIRKYENPSFEMKHGSLVCNTGRDKILSLPKGIEFDDIPAKQSNWLLDTPGVINHEQVYFYYDNNIRLRCQSNKVILT